MAWDAKPSGGFTLDSQSGGENIHLIHVFCNNHGYTIEACAGMLGNIYVESGLNPWRWEGDTYGAGRGYGLFQYTPARDYLNLGNTYGYFAPNRSTTEITTGAQPEDGQEQLLVMENNRLSKWGGGLWRNWDTSTYSALYAHRNRIVTEWGNGSSVSQAQYKKITSLYDATFAFMAGFEGPLVPNQTARYNWARQIYVMLGGTDPGGDPDPPHPIHPPKIPLWLLFEFNRR